VDTEVEGITRAGEGGDIMFKTLYNHELKLRISDHFTESLERGSDGWRD
jgi:hypothetical protein